MTFVTRILFLCQTCPVCQPTPVVKQLLIAKILELVLLPLFVQTEHVQHVHRVLGVGTGVGRLYGPNIINIESDFY